MSRGGEGDAARFYAHGGEGRTRDDGSTYSAATDAESYAAEAWGCEQFGRPVDRRLGEADHGYDLVLLIDFKHLGLLPNGEPRRDGNLIVNPGKVRAHRYYVISGSRADGFRFEGYATDDDVKRRPPKDFGFGPKLWVPVHDLRGR